MYLNTLILITLLFILFKVQNGQILGSYIHYNLRDDGIQNLPKCNAKECDVFFTTKINGSFTCKNEPYNPNSVKVEKWHQSAYTKEHSDEDVAVKNGSFMFEKSFIPTSGRKDIFLKLMVKGFCCSNNVDENCNVNLEIRLPENALECGHHSNTFDMGTMELGFHHWPRVYCSNPTMFSNN